MEEKVRKPQPHFSSQERAALLLIVKKYEKYIEENSCNKKVSRFNKNRAWMVIKTEFNKAVGSIGNERDVNSLRSKYIDMRKKHVQATRHKRAFGHDSNRNLLQELIDEVQQEELNDDLVSIKNEPIELLLLEEEEYGLVDEQVDDSDTLKRGTNYTNYEKFLLMKLVDKHRNCIINNGGSDATIRSEKSNTWDTIAKEFRILCPDGQYRTAQKLRDKFSDMKKVHRKTIKYSATRDKEFHLMKKLLDNKFDQEDLPELPSSALSKVLNEAPVCIEALPDINHDEVEEYDEINRSIESAPMNCVDHEESSKSDEGVFQSNQVVQPHINAQEQYYIEKNRREEEEHRMNMEILRLRIQKETLEMKFRKEEHEMRKDVLCREMEKND